MQPISRAAFAAGVAASAAALPYRGVAQTLAAVRATSAIDDPATPFLYALENGLFKRNGIDASIERSTSGAASMSAVVGGTFDVGKSSTVSFVSAFARGLPIVAIAPAGDFDISRPPTSGLVVKPDSPVRTGADLNGKTVAVSALNDIFTLSVRAWVDQHGGDSSTLKPTEVPISSAVDAVASGRIDAAVVIEPFLARALAAKQIRSISTPIAALGNHHTDSLWFTTAAYVQKNTGTVNRFVRTLHDAAVYVNAHPAETAPLLTAFAKIDPTDVSKVRVLQGTRLEASSLQPIVDAAAKYGLIPKRIDAKEMIFTGATPNVS